MTKDTTLEELDYHALNAKLNLLGKDGKLQLDGDKEALDVYLTQEIAPRTKTFPTPHARIQWLIDNNYYRAESFNYTPEFINRIHEHAENLGHEFSSFMGAFKFYMSYAMKTNDGKTILETFPQRAVSVACHLANGNEEEAMTWATEIIEGRMQPATPTFLNSGKVAAGGLVSCFPAGTMITMASGAHKPIEKIQIGDIVRTHTGDTQRVYDLIVNYANTKPMVQITAPIDQSITCTNDHPILVYTVRDDVNPVLTDELLPNNHYWIKAGDVKPWKDCVIKITPEGRKIMGMVESVTSAPDCDTVYNLEVENDHSYVANGISAHNCFVAGTRVTLSDGTSKPIEDINVGDEVITHTGSRKKVFKFIKNKNSKPIFSLKAAGVPLIKCTSDHPILVYTERVVNKTVIKDKSLPDGFYWIEACEVEKNKDYLVTPLVKRFEIVDKLDMRDIVYAINSERSIGYRNFIIEDGSNLIRYRNSDKKGRFTNTYCDRIHPIPAEIPLNEDFGRFVGYYLSEGCLAFHKAGGCLKKRPSQVCFTFGLHEKEFIDDLISISESLFGITPSVSKRSDNSCRVTISSAVLSRAMLEYFGTGFNKKSLSDEIISGNDKFLYNLLIGAFRSDGCLSENKITLTLSNPNLVRQLREISIRLGLSPAMRDYFSASGSPTSTLSMSSHYPHNEQFIFDVAKNLHNYIEPSSFIKLYHRRKGDFYLSNVVDVRKTNDCNTVYNLEVEDDHTYLVEGVVAHNCFILDTIDSLEGIARTLTDSLQLSKRGGGVGINLSNVREAGAPIKGVEGQSSGLIPVMKLLEDSFSYANQLGARQGAGVVYVHAHHPDILSVLDTKRENADEKIRIKTLSLGVTIPDITFHLAKKNEPMYTFSPYDVEREYGKAFSEVDVTAEYYNMVENPRIRKKQISARKLFSTIAELQFESGYPYLFFVDNANREHNIEGKVKSSNLCSEVMMLSTPSSFNADGTFSEVGRDISCNLASMNIAKVMDDAPNIANTVSSAIRFLTRVSDFSSIDSSPTVIKGNKSSHAIGLGAMNLHGFLAREKVRYGDDVSVDFTDAFFRTMFYHAVHASSEIAREKGESFYEFELSKYASGEAFDKYMSEPEYCDGAWDLLNRFGFVVPSVDDWVALKEKVARDGMYNAYLMAVAPTGSISYITGCTASLHPITAAIEARKEGKLGRVYYPQPFLSDETLPYYRTAYDMSMHDMLKVYEAASRHVDQGISTTLFINKEDSTTRTLNKIYIDAWRRGLKSLYYTRVRTKNLAGTEVENLANSYCESCVI